MMYPDYFPTRYQREWGVEFWERVNGSLQPGVAILDVGGGRRPTIAPTERPEGTHYVGLDSSGAELETAAPGSYDEKVVADAGTFVPDLVERFDLIVAWQVLEHLRDLPAAASAFHRYARSGAMCVACLSGRNAAFAVANRILPTLAASRLVARLRSRPLETVFPAYYDHCDPRGLRESFASWDEIEVIPLWRGADYFLRLPLLRGLYIRYENWAIAKGRDNLATHYVIAARKR